MPRPRTPKAKAKATGQDIGTHKAVFEPRNEPVVTSPLGDPPKWMKKASQIEAWNTIAEDIPWLNRSHRILVGTACEILSRQIEGEPIGIQAITALRQCMSEMGGTPSAASKVTMPDGKKSNEDPSAKYF